MVIDRTHKPIVTPYAEQSLEVGRIGRDEAQDAFLRSDKVDKFGPISIFFKMFDGYILLGAANKRNGSSELLFVYKILDSLAEKINPLLLRSITGQKISFLGQLQPVELMEVFFEAFSAPVLYNDRLAKFYIDNEKKMIVTGTLDLDKYKHWLEGAES